MSTAFWPLVVYFFAVLAIAGGMLLISYLLGERQKDRAKIIPYESGVLPTGSARLRFSVKFYVVAMFFVIFDVESIFIFAWAVAVKESGWLGFIAMFLYIMIILAGLFYLWRLGVLDWARKHE